MHTDRIESTVRRCLGEAVAFAREHTGKSTTELDICSASYTAGVVRTYRALLAACSARRVDPSAATVVDLGVGKGWSSYILSHFFKQVLAYDLAETVSEQMGLEGEKWQTPFWKHFGAGRDGLRYAFFDGEHIPFEDATADVVFANAVLEHVGENSQDNGPRLQWLLEVRRIMRPGAVMIIATCPNRLSYAEWLAKLLRLPHHARCFRRQELLNLFGQAGLEVPHIEYTHPYIDFFPGRAQAAWNSLYEGAMHHLDQPLCRTPFRYIAHHFRLVATKPRP